MTTYIVRHVQEFTRYEGMTLKRNGLRLAMMSSIHIQIELNVLQR